MNFKKPKQQLASEASWRAYNKITSNLNSLQYSNQTGFAPIIAEAVRDGIEEALNSLIENIYTDQDFEEDLTLRDKA